MYLMEMKGHGYQGLHGCNPNPPHYIKESLALEIDQFCVRTRVGRFQEVFYYSLKFQRFVVICDFHLRHPHYQCQALKFQAINHYQKVCNSASFLCFNVPHAMLVRLRTLEKKICMYISKTQIQGFQGCMYTLGVLECSKPIIYNMTSLTRA